MKICAVIDFETLDTKHSARLLSAGITYFDLHKADILSTLEEQSLHLVFNSVGQKNRTQSYDTNSWWKEQPEETWELATKDRITYPLQVGLFKMIEFLNDHKVEHIIGNGVNFDNMIFKHACEEMDLEYPRPYWSDLDLRTMHLMSRLDKPNFPKKFIQHYARHDAVFEAQCAQLYWRTCNGE